jgi:hypothetical protein
MSAEEQPVRYWRHTLVIYAPFGEGELSDIAREAETGSAICTSDRSEPVALADMPDDARSFFGAVS